MILSIFRANTLKSSRRRSLKCPHQLQTHIPKAFLSSLCPFTRFSHIQRLVISVDLYLSLDILLWIIPTCGFLYRLGPGGPESMKRKQKTETNIPWVTWKTSKALEQGLHHSRRHRASSQGGLESPGRRVSSAGFHAPENLERERERERRTWGPKSLVDQSALLNFV